MPHVFLQSPTGPEHRSEAVELALFHDVVICLCLRWAEEYNILSPDWIESALSGCSASSSLRWSLCSIRSRQLIC